MITEQTKHAVVTLTATSKSGAIKRHELAAEQGIFIGKSSNCGFQLDGEGLSDIHCRVGLDDGEVWVQDWMSAEGTQVNGQEIASNEKIDAGDVIKIGNHEITVAYGSMASVTAAEADGAAKPPVAAESKPKSKSPSRTPEPVCPTESTPSAEQLESESAIESSPESDVESTSLSNDSGEQLSSSAEADVQVSSRLTESAEAADEEPATMDFSADFFDFEEEETYDRETVALLQAEIEELQTQLAQRDAERANESFEAPVADNVPEESDQVLQRMQDLIDEANRSDERVAILEELLHAAEDASRSEIEERGQLEAWVGDIEKRVGQREEEHAAELDALRNRLEQSSEQQDRLQQQLRHAATGGSAPKHYEDTLENLQQSNKQMQDDLAEAQKQCRVLEQRLKQQSEDGGEAVRTERANLAQEQAKIARLRFELSSKLASVDEMPKSENSADRETAHRIQTLRQHLKEIHEQEKKEEKEAPLTTRLAKLWKRTEY
jgi:pSer/pThr/pTyr-binding forkhead associated (FHA) protein